MIRLRPPAIVALALSVSALSGFALTAQERPALVVMLTVDQMRPDYVDRFGADLTGGFARLARDGAFFTHGMQDHAMTSTAPGHAALWSGRFPAHTGIVSNDLGVPDPDYPLVAGASGAGASPRRFRGSALYDWLLAVDPATRMLSVSRKDRGAILPVGKARASVFWWSDDGVFTTSRYYADALPAWVERWNASLRAEEWSGRTWAALLPESAYTEPDAQPNDPAFPHRIASIREMKDVPWIDSLTLDLAISGARELALGSRDSPDLLAVSLSALDAIGHDFGPDSREVRDHFVRLDRWLGSFMTQLEEQLAGRSILFVLSSDHGVTSMPEQLRARGMAHAGRVDLDAALADAVAPLQGDFGILLQDGLVLADTLALRAHGTDVGALASRIAGAFAALDGVGRAFTPEDLRDAEAEGWAGRWRRSIPAEYGWLAAAEPETGWVFGVDESAHHGTPLEENVIVPIFFLGAGIHAQRVERPVRTVDVAPTIASLLRLRPTETLDGRLLSEVLAPD